MSMDKSEIFKKRLLIVDDNDFSRAVIEAKLKKAGYSNIVIFGDSTQAWDTIANSIVGDEDKIDLVITDLNMPGLDGMDMIGKIKEDPMSEHIKIIVVSADPDKTVIDITKSLGALAYITKPIVTEELTGVVEAILMDKKIPETKGMFQVPEL